MMTVMKDRQSVNPYCTQTSSCVGKLKLGCSHDPSLAFVCECSDNLVLCCCVFNTLAWWLTCSFQAAQSKDCAQQRVEYPPVPTCGYPERTNDYRWRAISAIHSQPNNALVTTTQCCAALLTHTHPTICLTFRI